MAKKTTNKRSTGAQKKLPWKSMEMMRVKLNPEQAVLSCCDQPNRGVDGGTTSWCGMKDCHQDGATEAVSS